MVDAAQSENINTDTLIAHETLSKKMYMRKLISDCLQVLYPMLLIGEYGAFLLSQKNFAI